MRQVQKHFKNLVHSSPIKRRLDPPGETEPSYEGAETAEDVRADQIGSVLPRFNPGKEFKRVLDAIKFNKN